MLKCDEYLCLQLLGIGYTTAKCKALGKYLERKGCPLPEERSNTLWAGYDDPNTSQGQINRKKIIEWLQKKGWLWYRIYLPLRML